MTQNSAKGHGAWATLPFGSHPCLLMPFSLQNFILFFPYALETGRPADDLYG